MAWVTHATFEKLLKGYQRACQVCWKPSFLMKRFRVFLAFTFPDTYVFKLKKKPPPSVSCSPSLLGYEQTRVLQDRVVISTIWSRGKRYHFIFRLGSHSGSHMHSPTERKQFHFPDTPCVFKPTSPGTCLYTVFPLKSCHGQPPRIHKQHVVLNHFWDFLYSMLWNDRLSPIETLHFLQFPSLRATFTDIQNGCQTER